MAADNETVGRIDAPERWPGELDGARVVVGRGWATEVSALGAAVAGVLHECGLLAGMHPRSGKAVQWDERLMLNVRFTTATAGTLATADPADLTRLGFACSDRGLRMMVQPGTSQYVVLTFTDRGRGGEHGVPTVEQALADWRLRHPDRTPAPAVTDDVPGQLTFDAVAALAAVAPAYGLTVDDVARGAIRAADRKAVAHAPR